MYELTIYYDEEKDVLKVDGPIRHPILCYGMMERARDVIKDLVDQGAKGTEIVGTGDTGKLLKTKLSGNA